MSRISGMTGFGRADGALDGWTWTVEARSVNGRSLEVRYRGPGGFENLERLTKATAQARLNRGQVTLGVQAKRAEGNEPAPRVNEAVLATYLKLANQLAEEGAVPPSADGLLALRGVIEVAEAVEDPEGQAAVEAAIAVTIEQALDALKQSRQREGEQLTPVIHDFVGTIEALVARAELEASSQTEAIRERFTRRISELAPDAPGLDERIFLEAAALATKADVREELDRLTAHVDSARTLLQQPPAGRKLDFLMQEFMREANTLCSKSATTPLTGIGLELKAVIEQLREQVQNVE
ncbi:MULTISPECIES: YicC/YloC family endoribonuclease [unclassified Brevundimonas]|uniref:YicC/YloC family endoribonuclease n=1 Tax=unclassified Brevundimonas TaxID=2622653 RepID=UPI000CFBDD37|nr:MULTISPECIES: YicC/YloC family endoribonuclease [unclassified Brevundimonas]PRA32655.1 YicC family protein [Brevundimonas sp. MYb27]PQZ77619.1 YicC family protein [Brevundimonas sp. MYb31]PRB16865.1 YicC family protein [Brevundimonas sp. MYb52]PRB37420.1 YicC family protein [Brevundimonas sp. MYb46]PRB47672.1 YicC family protein [Brevundimonas sp. MYb33]